MATSIDPIWRLARRQHDVISRAQLIGLGYTHSAIRHMVAAGRLYPLFRGVYAVGRPRVTHKGLWMAAVLACGEAAALSHESAAALWGICRVRTRLPEVTLPHASRHRRPGIATHRSRTIRASDVTRREGVPVTTVVRTLIDLSRDRRIERMVNEADRLGLVNPEQLRRALAGRGRGAARLARLLDGRTFRLTASELERMFLPIVRRAGLPLPLTGQTVNGFEVDFFWPELRLVVETDGLRYHRTPAQQARDRLRDQVHTAAGLTALRFTHQQIAFEDAHVEHTLRATAGRLRRAAMG
jgi:very-short-patch-repair endonuclease